MPDLISIIIPVYKNISAVRICLTAIQKQTHSFKEIIIVDDGNANDTRQIIHNLAREFNARYLKQDARRGAARARNIGASVANGELLFFCDADIKLNPNALAELARAFSVNPDAAFAYGDFIATNGITMRGRAFNVFDLKARNFISTMSLVRRAAFCGFDETLNRFQDWDLWLTITKQGGNGIYVPEVIFTVCAAGSISRWVPSWIIEHHNFFHWIPRVSSYCAARKIIEVKHDLAAAHTLNH